MFISSRTTFNLAIGQSVIFKIGGSGTATVFVGSLPGQSYVVGQQEAFIGPFTASASIVIDVSNGSIEYVIDRDGVLDDQAPAIAALNEAAGLLPPYLGPVSAIGATCDSTLVSFGSKYATSVVADIANQEIVNPQLLFANWYTANSAAGDTDGAGALEIRASLEYPIGTFNRFQFSGSYTGTIAAGDRILSDALPLTVPRGAKYRIRMWFHSEASSIHYRDMTGICDVGQGEAFNHSATALTDITVGGAVSDAGAGGLIIPPLALLGMTNRPTFALFGDSRFAGTQDGSSADAYGFRGELGAVVGRKYGLINISRGGEYASTIVSSSARRRGLIDYCSHVIGAHAINDIHNGWDAGTMATRMAAYWALLKQPGKKLLGVTYAPQGVTTSDSYATVAGQTASAQNPVRVSVNALVRSMPSPLDGFIEIADAVESARDSGKFKPLFTLDGTHETRAAYAEIARSVRIEDYI